MRVEPSQRGRRIRSFAEKDNSFDHIVVVLNDPVGPMVRSSNLAQANLRPLCNRGDVFYSQGSAVLRFDHCLLDVIYITDKSYSANIDLLRTLFDETAADVCVAV